MIKILVIMLALLSMVSLGNGVSEADIRYMEGFNEGLITGAIFTSALNSTNSTLIYAYNTHIKNFNDWVAATFSPEVQTYYKYGILNETGCEIRQTI